MQHTSAHHDPRNHHPRHGFTLVEMLVVITIIGVLVALLIPVINGVMKSARNAAIVTDLNNLSQAMEEYKRFANEYPPDFTNRQAVINHVAKAFPRNTQDVGAWYDANPNLDPAEAIVLWLNMLSTNVKNPLSGTLATYTGERKEFGMKLDEARLGDIDGDGWKEFYPKYGNERPYVYFDGRLIGGKYAYTGATWPRQSPLITNHPNSVSGEIIRPFRSDTPIDTNRDNNRTNASNTPSGTNTTQWVKPGAFQLICAGQDNEFGIDNTASGNPVEFKTFPTPNYQVPSSDEDNITDFSDGKTLAERVP